MPTQYVHLKYFCPLCLKPKFTKANVETHLQSRTHSDVTFISKDTTHHYPRRIKFGNATLPRSGHRYWCPFCSKLPRSKNELHAHFMDKHVLKNDDQSEKARDNNNNNNMTETDIDSDDTNKGLASMDDDDRHHQQQASSSSNEQLPNAYGSDSLVEAEAAAATSGVQPSGRPATSEKSSGIGIKRTRPNGVVHQGNTTSANNDSSVDSVLESCRQFESDATHVLDSLQRNDNPNTDPLLIENPVSSVKALQDIVQNQEKLLTGLLGMIRETKRARLADDEMVINKDDLNQLIAEQMEPLQARIRELENQKQPKSRWWW